MPIVFEPLVSSPETFGDGLAYLPPLFVYGQEAAGGYGISHLPALTGVSAGIYGIQYAGTGSAALPVLGSFGLQAAGGYGIGFLPLFQSSALDDQTLIPQGSAALGYLPAFASSGAGRERKVGIAEAVRLRLRGIGLGAYTEAVIYANTTGTASASLPRLKAYGHETAVDYGVGYVPALSPYYARGVYADYGAIGGFSIASLPDMRGSGLQAFPTLTAFASLVPVAPHMQGYAGLVVNAPASGVVGWIATQNAIAATSLTDILFSTAFATNDIIKCLFERIETTGTAFPSSTRYTALTDGLAYSAALAVAWQLALDEEIEFAGQAQADTIKLAVLVDTLHALGAVTNRLDAFSALATTLAINGMLATGWAMSAIDTVAFQDALAGQLIAVGAIVDSAGFADTPLPAMRLMAFTDDSLSFDTALAASLQAFEALHDQLLFYTTLRLGDAEYAGWVMNEGAVSEYRNYPFNGFVKFAGKYYGTADDGLYLLEGPDDAGTPIDAHITTALMDFGTGLKKRVPDVYLAFAGGDTVVLKVTTTGPSGVKAETIYTADVRSGDALHNGRVKVGKGLVSRYWQFTLANKNGDELTLDELAFKPVVLDRRL